MKSHKAVGLVGAGGVNQSFLARMPALLGQLGPVAGSSLRVSRRISNGLNAGFGARDDRALAACTQIWISVPEDALDERSRQLARAIDLQGKIVILCGVLRDSFHPSPLRTGGARVATLNSVPESEERVFVAEGHLSAIAAIKKVLVQDQRKLIELQPLAKPLYLSGILLGTHLLMPWIAGAVESLRASGFSRSEATLAVQAMGTRALRAFAKAGHKAHDQAAARRLHQAIQPDLEAIRRTDMHLAVLYAAGIEELLGIPSESNDSKLRLVLKESRDPLAKAKAV